MNNLTRIQLLNANKVFIDITDETTIPITFSIGDIRDISQRNGAFSKSINVKGTKNNNIVFNNYFDVNIVENDITFNINKKVYCNVIQNGTVILQNMLLQLVKIQKRQLGDNYDEEIIYTLLIKDNIGEFFSIINTKYLDDIDLGLPVHTYTSDNVFNSFSNEVTDGYKYVMCFNPSQGTTNSTLDDNQFNLEEFKPGIYAKTYFDRIFNGAGYRYNWGSKDNQFINFSKLIIPYNGDEFKSDEIIQTELASLSSVGYPSIESSLITIPNPPTPNTKYKISHSYKVKVANITEISDTGNTFDVSTQRFLTLDLPSNKNKNKFIFKCRVQIIAVNTDSSSVTLKPFSYSTNQFFDNGSLGVVPQIQLRKNGKETISVTKLLDSSITKVSLPNGLVVGAGSSLTLYDMNLEIPFETTGMFDNDYFELFLNTIIKSNGNVKIENSVNVKQDMITWNFFKAGNIASTKGRIDTSVTNVSISYSQEVTGDYGYNTDINLNKFIPKKIKQSDFVKSLSTMFNLYFEVDKDDKKLINIYTRNEYYDAGERLDWTDKLAKNETQELMFLPELQNKKILLTYKEDKDFANEVYKNSTNEIYGQYEFTFDNEYVKDIDKKELIFSPTPMYNSKGLEAVLPMMIGNAPANNIRIMLDNGDERCNNYTIINYKKGTLTATTEYSLYPFISHVNNELTPSFDINFGVCDYYFRTDGFTPTTNNLYNIHWRRTINQINTGKLFTAMFNLDESDIAKLKLNSRILVNNSWWNINKIIDYDANDRKLTKVELISVDDGVQTQIVDKTVKRLGNDSPIWNDILFNFGLLRDKFVNIKTEAPYFLTRGFNNFITSTNALGSIIGSNNTVSDGGVIYGSNNNVLANSFVVGDSNVSQGNNSFVIGSNNYVDENVSNAINLGSNNTISSGATDTINIGSNNIITSGAAGSIILGNGITATTPNTTYFNNISVPPHVISNRTFDGGISNLLNIENTKPDNPYTILELWANRINPLEATLALFLPPTGFSPEYRFIDLSCLNYDNDPRGALVMQSRDCPLYPFKIAYSNGVDTYNQYQFDPDGAFKLLHFTGNQRMELGAYGRLQDYIRDNNTRFPSSRATSLFFNGHISDYATNTVTRANLFAPTTRIEQNGDGQILFQANDLGGSSFAASAFTTNFQINANGNVFSNVYKLYNNTRAKTEVRIEDFGGEANNSSFDNYSAIMAALAAANAAKTYVYIPANTTYYIGNEIYLNTNDKIVGENKFTSVIKLQSGAPSGSKTLRNINFSGGNSNIHLENFTIDASMVSLSVCLELQLCSNINIKNMHILGGDIEGVYLYLGSHIIVTDLETHDNGLYQVDASGIHFDTCSFCVLNGCVTYNNGFHGVILSTTDYTTLNDIVAHDNGFNGVLTQTSSNHITIDAICYNNFRGMYFIDSSYITCNGDAYNNLNNTLTNESTNVIFNVNANGPNGGVDLYLVGSSDSVTWYGSPNPTIQKDSTGSTLNRAIYDRNYFTSYTGDANLTIDMSNSQKEHIWIANFTAGRTLSLDNLTNGKYVEIFIRNINGTPRLITIQCRANSSGGYSNPFLSAGAGTASVNSITLAATTGSATIIVKNANGIFYGSIK